MMSNFIPPLHPRVLFWPKASSLKQRRRPESFRRLELVLGLGFRVSGV